MPLLALCAASLLIFDVTWGSATGEKYLLDLIVADTTNSSRNIAGLGKDDAHANLPAISIPVRVALLVLSIAEIASPIVPLALVPAAAGDVLGAAYGTIEGMFALAQMSIALLLGVVRGS